MKKVIIVLMSVLLVSPAVFGAPVNFDSMNVASKAFGLAGYEGRPNLLATYKNKIYFILSQDGSEYPSKLYCYDPFDGLSNTANHSILAESTGQFIALERLDELLYFADTLGRVFVYDGMVLNELTATPFSSSDFVTSFEKFNGLFYYGTSNSNIFRFDGVTYEQVYAPADRQRIFDMVAWQKDGRLYVSIGPVTWCCPNTAYAIRSNSGDANSWETVLQNIYYVADFTPVSDYLYLTVTDSSGGYQSSVRKSSDGISFPKIH